MYNSEADTQRIIQDELMIDERILWSGQPDDGFLFRPEDIFVIPFGIMWLGFSLFWEFLVISSLSKTENSLKWVPILFGVPFILIGIYLLIGRFYVDMRMRRRTHYAVTNRRIIILKTGFLGSTKSIGLSQIPDITLSVKPGRSKGHIILGASSPLSINPNHSSNQLPRLEALENARDVHEIILNAQRDLRNAR